MNAVLKPWGATPREWAHFAQLDLTPDLLPVVSNPHAPVSERSSVTATGKVPSDYNTSGEIRGIPAWTARESTASDVATWSGVPDYGICVQTRSVRAIDVDVTDPELAASVHAFIASALNGRRLPERRRANSPKFLLAVIVHGEMPKRKIETTAGIVEFLANGQQFVAVGTHPSGARYEWVDGLPAELPTLTPGEFEDLWLALDLEFGVGDSTTGTVSRRQNGERLHLPDPLADHLRERNLVLKRVRGGGLAVACPWASEHTSGAAGDSSTLYYPAGTRGYSHGAFKCLHGHCAHRTTHAFARAVGYVDPSTTPEADFGAFDDEPEPPPVAAPAAGGASPPEGPPAKPINVFNPTDYATIARAMVVQKFGGEDVPTLRRWHGAFYVYRAGAFHETDIEELPVRVQRFLVRAKRFGPVVDKVRQDPTPFHPTSRHVSEVINALRAILYVSSDSAPTWTRGTSDDVSRGMRPDEIVSLGNGLFHMPTKVLMPHTPAYFTLNALPFNYEPEATCPEWLKFLNSVFVDDEQSIATLQEMFGYLLTADTSLQKMFALIGPPRAGKGVIARVLGMLLGGHDNVCGPTLQSLSTQFGLAPLVGRLVAVIGDARSAGQSSQTTIERLLSITGEDTLTVDRKMREPWAGKLAARIVMMSNEALSLPDASGALTSRMVVITLTKSFLGHEDTQLERRITGELAGVFRWALEGRDRLKARGYFTQPDASAETIEQMRELNSPIRTFVDDCCELGPELSVSKRALYTAYRAWAIGAGLTPPSEEIVSKNLFAAFPAVKSIRPRTGGKARARSFTGVALLDDSVSELE